MSLNGSGVAVINSSGQPVVASTLITSAAFNAATADLATMISTCLMKDGQQTVTANIPMGTFKFTGLGDGSLIQDSATIKNLQNGTGVYAATVGGTSDVITLTTNPAITAYVAGQTFRFIAGGANTTNVTVAISGLAAKAITKNGTTALIANDILSAQMVSITYDGTRFILGTHLTADIVTLTGSQVLTNKTLTTPTIASLTGTTLTNAILTTSTVAADPTTALGVASKQYVDRTVASYSSTDTLAAGVGLALLSGASFAFTLPAAASHTNREVTIIHQGTSLSQVYTITGNAAETIIGKDATGNTYALYTNGETIRLKCNGTSWIAIMHEATTDWVLAGAMTVTATSSNPTKPSSTDIDNVFWRRDGNQVFLRYIFQISSASGSAAGSGTYLFALPTNITFDTTILTPVAGAYTAATRSELSAAFLSGHGYVGSDSTSQAACAFFANTTGDFKVLIIAATDTNTGNADGVRSGQYDFTNSEQGYNFELNARAANWRL